MNTNNIEVNTQSSIRIKILIIISTIIIILIGIGLITSFKDNARVRAGIEPKYTIKIINDKGSKVTYIGLGYKVVRYVGVSPNEPFGKNDNYKYGSWFMKYDNPDKEENNIEFHDTDLENVKIGIIEVHETDAIVIIKDMNKNPYTYGEWYKIEQADDGLWKEVPIIAKEGYGFNDMAYTVNEKNEVRFEIDWTYIYGKLPSGSYRLVKKVNNKEISIEFNLGETSK